MEKEKAKIQKYLLIVFFFLPIILISFIYRDILFSNSFLSNRDVTLAFYPYFNYFANNGGLISDNILSGFPVPKRKTAAELPLHLHASRRLSTQGGAILGETASYPQPIFADSGLKGRGFPKVRGQGRNLRAGHHQIQNTQEGKTVDPRHFQEQSQWPNRGQSQQKTVGHDAAGGAGLPGGKTAQQKAVGVLRKFVQTKNSSGKGLPERNQFF